MTPGLTDIELLQQLVFTNLSVPICLINSESKGPGYAWIAYRNERMFWQKLNAKLGRGLKAKK